MRNWITIVVVFFLVVGSGLLLARLQGGEALQWTTGYVPELDASQAFLLAAAVGVLLVSTVGMGATLAFVMWIGGRQVAVAKAQAAAAEAAQTLREPSKAAPQAAPARRMNWGGASRAVVVAANVFVLAFAGYLTLDHYVLNPPAEDAHGIVAPGPEGGAPTAAPPPAQAGGPGGFAALPAGDAGRGQTVFTTQPCASCHSLVPDQVLVGPSLAGIAAYAAEQPGYTPEEFIYESITDPGAVITPGFQDGLMPQNFAQVLTPQQLADLVAFLMTQ